MVGDLAQFMVQNDLTEDDVREQAETLSFPSSVVDFFEGRLGQPLGGFPEPMRSRVLRGRPPIEGRPGETLEPLDLTALEAEIREEHPFARIREVDVMSAALYPEVFRQYRVHRSDHGDVSRLPTRVFLAPLDIGEEVSVEIEHGKTLIIVLRTVGELDETGHRPVFFELNGQPRQVRVRDRAATAVVKERERATGADGSIGAPMPGSVVKIDVKAGADVERGDPLVVLSAMKMETVVGSPVSGRVLRVAVKEGDTLAAGDLLVEIDAEKDEAA